MVTMSLAKRVRDSRYAKGWGPDELASRAEISRTALYQIESGKTELPRAGTLRRIARALDVSIEVLLGNAEGGNFPFPNFVPGGTEPASHAKPDRNPTRLIADEEPFAKPARPAESYP